ncbi:MAG: outer membrane beta-barrel protein [Fibrobacter sp.]|nr:outer membrane beta-barrel protein [Fibrobacter sp.]
MKSSLLKIIAAASITFAAFGFAQEDDEWPQEESQEESVQSEEQDNEAEEAPATAQAEEQTSAPEKAQDNVQENSSSNSQAYAESESEAYESPAKKGPNFSIGAKVAFNYGMMFGFDEQDDEVDEDPSGMGFEAGLMGRIEMVNNFYFAPEVNFSYIKSTHNYNERERSYTTMAIEIPLLLRGVLAERIYLTAGPQISIGISNEVEIKDKDVDYGDVPEYMKDKIDPSSFEFGIAAGGGYNVADRFFIDLRWYMGLTELFPDVAVIGDDIVPKNEEWYEVDSGKKYTGSRSIMNMAGAKMMKFKIGISYWFI